MCLKFWHELAGINNYTIVSKVVTFNRFNEKMPEWYNDKNLKSFTPKNSSTEGLPFDISNEFWYSDVWFEIVLKKNTDHGFSIPLDHLENDQQGELKERLRENYSRLLNNRNLIIPFFSLKARNQKTLAKKIKEHLKIFLMDR